MSDLEQQILARERYYRNHATYQLDKNKGVVIWKHGKWHRVLLYRHRRMMTLYKTKNKYEAEQMAQKLRQGTIEGIKAQLIKYQLKCHKNIYPHPRKGYLVFHMNAYVGFRRTRREAIQLKNKIVCDWLEKWWEGN